MSKILQEPLIVNNKYYHEDPVFRPENLLRESRRQNKIPDCNVPEICMLDPDGDLANWLRKQGKATKNECWACYHSTLYSFDLDGTEIGIIPCAVGASYAVLVAEQLFVSGCKLLISVTSAGIIRKDMVTKKFALITEAIRDEGTSYHYIAPETTAHLSIHLYQKLTSAATNTAFFEARSWTTDAPYRETESAIGMMKKQKAVCVEMEAAALYAFAQAAHKEVICFAHLTNTMAITEGDFEKGEEFGSLETLRLISDTIKSLDNGAALA